MTLDDLANKIYAESYDCCCIDEEHEEKSIVVEDVVQPLARFLSLMFIPFDKERFIRKSKGE